tara:strand:+ start:380 stop:1660 length:1281 start_codon:yes stop_codon:yes gene_type:complete
VKSINTKFIFYPLVILSIIIGVFLSRQKTDVEIYGPYFGFEEEYFQKELDLIGNDLNISIKYYPVIDVEAYILDNFNNGEVPDIAIMPNPQGVTNLGERSIAIPVNNFVDEDYIASIYPQHLIDITTSLQTSKNYGAWLRLFPNSLIWYNVEKYEKVGSPVFSSYEEVIDFTAQIASKDSEPWCLDYESGVATGWIATNWIEDILLTNYGPEVYDQWWQLKIEASSNTMLSAFLDLGRLAFGTNNVYGGHGRIHSKEFINLPKVLMDSNSPCIFSWMGHFISVYFPEEYSFGEDYDFMQFPSMKYSGAVVGIGDSLVLLNKTPDVIEVYKRLIDKNFGQYWMNQTDASFIPANIHSDIRKIENPLTYKEANIVRRAQEVNLFKFDASELMSRPIGSDKLWETLKRYIASGYLSSVYKYLAELDTHY